MTMKNIGLALVVIIAIATGAVLFSSNTVEKIVGASAGPEHTEAQFFYGGASLGSNCFATSTSGTLTTRTLLDNGCIHITAAGAGQAVISLTLPATTTMSGILPKAGSCREWFINADDVAAATTTTIVAGAGHVLIGLDATGAGTGADVIDGDEFGTLKMCRLSNGDVASYVQEYIHAD